ncbi:hypothetical protein CASFOL_010932 [Castilleja foliolosa]|uniref:TFIIS N-terminal domain-containing protein n=1 Tax=Castilleja foliolosa TaxID=1961234 RepID=A0ABD3DW16_9LAMI
MNTSEIALVVEQVMAELEVAAEEDHVLNTLQKPAINKLKKLPLLTAVLAKKGLQQTFLDHGVLSLLKNWLEPLPDKSLPSFEIRSAVLNILKDLPIDMNQLERRDQLKKSGIGKVVMFLSKSDEEKTVNRKLAQELVDKWSRPIFNKSTRFEDMKNFEDHDQRVSVYRRIKPSLVVLKRVVTSKATERVSQADDLDLTKFSKRQKSLRLSCNQHVVRPEAMSMDFVVRPQSKFVKAQSNKQIDQNPRMTKIAKKLQKLKASKRRQLQAAKPSVQGRGMLK